MLPNGPIFRLVICEFILQFSSHSSVNVDLQANRSLSLGEHFELTWNWMLILTYTNETVTFCGFSKPNSLTSLLQMKTLKACQIDMHTIIIKLCNNFFFFFVMALKKIWTKLPHRRLRNEALLCYLYVIHSTDRNKRYIWTTILLNLLSIVTYVRIVWWFKK